MNSFQMCLIIACCNRRMGVFDPDPLFSGVRAPGIIKCEFSAVKNTSLGEKRYVQFRAEFVNAFNHPMFTAPNTSPTNTAFGTLTSARTARTIQFGIRVHY